jgi:hypothetical protein
MYRNYTNEIIYGQSVLYKDDERVKEIKEINNNLTILYFLENEKEYPFERMDNILTKVSERKNTQSPLPSPSTTSSLSS